MLTYFAVWTATYTHISQQQLVAEIRCNYVRFTDEHYKSTVLYTITDEVEHMCVAVQTSKYIVYMTQIDEYPPPG